MRSDLLPHLCSVHRCKGNDRPVDGWKKADLVSRKTVGSGVVQAVARRQDVLAHCAYQRARALRQLTAKQKRTLAFMPLAAQTFGM